MHHDSISNQEDHMAGTGREVAGKLFIAGVGVVLSTFMFMPIGALGQQRGPVSVITEKLGQAVSSVYNSATSAAFTISRIEPNVRDNQVSIHFTDNVDFRNLRNNLKFIPPVPLEWHNSLFDGKTNVLVLRGHFKPGQRYALILPQDYKSAYGKTYAKGVTSFAMPDRPSELAYLEQGSVIERDSRQMLQDRKSTRLNSSHQ